ncbi:MAG: SDR family oxidoreductase [Gammaproteobacteria bacterium]|nr:SDR family oxidoreductase [Gammaproteobacteria bacterium]
MVKRFQDKTVLILGATSGIGRTTALLFAGEGANVVIGGRNADGGNEVVRSIEAMDGNGLYVRTDVTDLGAMQNAVDRTVGTFGGLNVAFNNAGLAGTGNKTADESEADWLDMVNTKLNGVWRGMKCQIPAILESGGGSIVNMAGNWGLIGFPTYAAYCAAAHGVMGLTRASAMEYVGAGIRINAVCPGAVDAPILDRMTGDNEEIKNSFAQSLPVGRLCSQGDIADAVLWLASDAASYVNGVGLVLDGGGSP